VQEQRAAYEKLLANFDVPPEATVRAVQANGVSSLVVGREPDDPPTVLHLHGGAYIIGSAFGYRPLGGALALAADTGVLLPDYRLAPEHPFPAAIEDAVSAYEWMLARGVEPGEITVSGDSSGGGLAVSLLLTLRERKLPMPGRAVLMCPWVDLAHDLGDMTEDVRRFAAAYLGDHPADDPIASPLRADLSGFPPLLIQGATGDKHHQNTKALAERARSHGVDVALELYPVDAHVFQLFWSFLPEAAEALEAAGAFVREGGAATAGAA
jgi:acetyl esterase/lipase